MKFCFCKKVAKKHYALASGWIWLCNQHNQDDSLKIGLALISQWLYHNWTLLAAGIAYAQKDPKHAVYYLKLAELEHRI